MESGPRPPSPPTETAARRDSLSLERIFRALPHYLSTQSVPGIPVDGTEHMHLSKTNAMPRVSVRYRFSGLFAASALAGFLWAGSAYGQTPTTTINLATQAKNVDFASFPFTRPVTVGTTLPTTCQVGQLFFNSTATAGANLYGCTAANNWTTLTGSNNAVPQVTLTPTTLSFGNQTSGTTSAGKNVTLLNSGTAFLALTGVTLSGPNAGDFLVSNSCGTTVPSGATCLISVSFRPSILGAESAFVNISGNEPSSPVSFPVTGTGTAIITSGGLTVTPSAITAAENAVVTFSANRPVNWALANGSSGTLVINSSTSATYTAPASISAQNSLGGCPVMPNDSVFNTRIDKLPLESHSGTWTANMGSNGISFLTSWGTNIADSTTPVQNMSFYYTTGNNGPFVTPQWPALKREGGTFVTDQNSSDHHIMTVRRDNCQFYELYNNYFSPRVCRDGKTQGCNATSGANFGWNSYAALSNGSTDAASLPLAPLTLHLDEIKSGVIRHAMRFTLAGGYVNANPYWPANSGNGCGGCTNSPPYGARFRLKASFDISTYSATAQVILTALKQYGMFLADAGTGPTITASTDLTEDGTVMSALGEISGKKIGPSNFEAVDESSFIVSTNSYQVSPFNSYQTPASFAVVSATDQITSTYQVNYPLPLQSVVVGIPSPTLWMIAGVPAQQLTSWVTGTSNQNTTWSLVSGVGSVTPGGVYTPPASVAAISKAILKVTSTADPNASASLYVTVLPTGNNPAGSIRIDSGNYNPVTDGGGNPWIPDQAYETGGYVELTGDYPAWPNQSNPEIRIYESAGYTYGNDVVYSLLIPNGNYKVRLMFGQHYNGCYPNCPATINPNGHNPLYLEANGQIGLHNFNFGALVNYQFAIPVDAVIPAQVTNNNLYVAIRANLPNGPTNLSPTPLINGVEIIPDSTPPYLMIDTQQQTSVAAGSTLQLYAIGWYMSNSVSWSISGPGAINQSGLYTAPATATSAAQTVTITAVSTANPAVQTSTTLTIPGSGS